MITIVDYGIGNLGSVQNMLKKVGAKSIVTSDLEEIGRAEKILLPGVGSFDAAISRIDSGGFRTVLERKAKEDKIPFLGICLGMQILTRGSEEGSLPGLGLIPASTVRFKFEDRSIKVPHMGWNHINVINSGALTENFTSETRFYFVHSYYVKCDSVENVVAKTSYGVEFDSIIQNHNVYGAQFHPEKSLRHGMSLLSNFSKM